MVGGSGKSERKSRQETGRNGEVMSLLAILKSNMARTSDSGEHQDAN